MGQINKGTIASIDDKNNTARVKPCDEGSKPTTKITIPWHLRGDTGLLKKGTEVIYVEFADSTGLILGRADGDWGEFLPELTTDKSIVNEKLEAANVEVDNDVKSNMAAAAVSLNTHVHNCTAPGTPSGPPTPAPSVPDIPEINT